MKQNIKITWKLQTRFNWVCTWRIMKTFNIPHAPCSGWGASQFSILRSTGLNDPEGPEKYNYSEWRSGQLFTAATQHLTPAVVMYTYLEKVIPRKHCKTSWKLQTQFDWVCTWWIIKNCNIPPAPSTGLIGIQFTTLKSAGLNDPGGPEKIYQHWKN
jgi:hypothetical protein